jgi:hypothetical protein
VPREVREIVVRVEGVGIMVVRGCIEREGWRRRGGCGGGVLKETGMWL